MTAPRSDALVIFGVTGDLAYKQIFPALLGLVLEGLDVALEREPGCPVVLTQGIECPRDQIAVYGRAPPAAGRSSGSWRPRP